ncbi:hypothetical protein [Aeoliella mucimassa]|uniref:PEP-CTERM protein-sorting domain-containing protein n=1 Tax=Aeoliella mucimassa TaxID=2527972 RepID=A0A518ARS6_9BACT|nr:hypothetical protein [Aeoliella mucimassa]QDU57408.1 hypothetical protein Pan181_36240 [Aeoliella mucimassa]
MNRLFVGGMLAAFAALAIGQASANPIHLSFGIDGREDDTTFDNFITLRDHHVSHYHVYFGNNGTNPNGHTPLPVDVLPGSSEYGEVTLASMNISPDAESDYLIPSTPEGDFHLELIGTAPELSVAVEREGVVTPLLPGGVYHLSVTEYHTLQFTLAEGTKLGQYDADFRIVDENGYYLSEVPVTPTYTWTNDFYVRVNAIPEPSTALLALLAVATGIVVLRR